MCSVYTNRIHSGGYSSAYLTFKRMVDLTLLVVLIWLEFKSAYTWTLVLSEIWHHYLTFIHVTRLKQRIIPWVHLRKMGVETPPLGGLPQTKSTTSLFTSDMATSTTDKFRGSQMGETEVCWGQLSSSGWQSTSLGRSSLWHWPHATCVAYPQSDSSGWQQTGG